MKGLTGLIKFHTNGFRSDFQLNIVRLEETGLRTIGTWNSTNSIEWLPEPPAKVAEGEEDLANKTFIVLISLVIQFLIKYYKVIFFFLYINSSFINSIFIRNSSWILIIC